jgi:DNA-binding response OmpR family regulator
MPKLSHFNRVFHSAAEREKAECPGAPVSHAGEATILVAEDDDELRGAIVEILREEVTWHVLEAHDGGEALALCRSGRAHAILLDERMPGLSGLEVLARLRAEGIATPVVLVTGDDDACDRASALGVDCVLGKPFTLQELVAVVRQALAGDC